MKGSLKIGVIAGIGIYLHWTFAILIVWIFTGSLVRGGTVGQATFGVFFIMALFGCVLLHELGHALTAKRYGVKTRDITLLPIGGLARLERIPENPIHEFWVAIAGPAVNVVIAVVLSIPLLAKHDLGTILTREFASSSVLFQLLYVNLLLVGFNLLPAFPMDGGRVLRALLAMKLSRTRATNIAARVGQFMAIGFALLGLFSNPMNPFLILIALFVFIGAQTEAELVETTSMLQGLKVRDAMMTRYRTLQPSDSLQVAINELLAGSQEDFPIFSDGQVQGVLQRKDLMRALADHRRNLSVGDLATRECNAVNANDALERVLERMRQENCPVVPVLENGQLAGLLTLDNISELVMVRTALGGAPRQPNVART